MGESDDSLNRLATKAGRKSTLMLISPLCLIEGYHSVEERMVLPKMIAIFGCGPRLLSVIIFVHYRCSILGEFIMIFALKPSACPLSVHTCSSELPIYPPKFH